MALGFREVILHVGRNSIRSMDETFEKSEILLNKFKELLVRGKEMGKKVRLGENEKWYLRALGVNARIQMLCESMNCSYSDVSEDFVDNFKMYKKDRLHPNHKGVEVFAVFARRMDECLTFWQKN